MAAILYSFKRCPYAMRARMALVTSGVSVVLREILLRDKPEAFLRASPSATVPCLVTAEGTLDESLDIMLWALRQNDPHGWLDMPDDGWVLIERCDTEFKAALDRTKYATRFPEAVPEQERAKASAFLWQLEEQLDGSLFGKTTLADHAILPFVRQFAFIDKDWFDAQGWVKVRKWLEAFLESEAFRTVMTKFPVWQAEEHERTFPVRE